MQPYTTSDDMGLGGRSTNATGNVVPQ
jgi:hypothetical protein